MGEGVLDQILGDDPRQRLRLTRFFHAAGVYVACGIAAWLAVG